MDEVEQIRTRWAGVRAGRKMSLRRADGSRGGVLWARDDGDPLDGTDFEVAAPKDIATLLEQLFAADEALRALTEEVVDLRAERGPLYAVAQAARAAIEHGWSKGSGTGDRVLLTTVGREKWRALAAAVEALLCWCGKPDGRHMSGCARSKNG